MNRFSGDSCVITTTFGFYDCFWGKSGQWQSLKYFLLGCLTPTVPGRRDGVIKQQNLMSGHQLSTLQLSWGENEFFG